MEQMKKEIEKNERSDKDVKNIFTDLKHYIFGCVYLLVDSLFSGSAISF